MSVNWVKMWFSRSEIKLRFFMTRLKKLIFNYQMHSDSDISVTLQLKIYKFELKFSNQIPLLILKLNVSFSLS